MVLAMEIQWGERKRQAADDLHMHSYMLALHITTPLVDEHETMNF